MDEKLHGDGIWGIPVLWLLAWVTSIAVALRLYTRLVVLKAFGVDDYIYNIAYLMSMIDTCLVTVGIHHGFASDKDYVSQLTPDEQTHAFYFTVAAAAASNAALGLARISIGLFLMRIVRAKWQKITLWFVLAAIFALSVAVNAVLFTHCSVAAHHCTPDAGKILSKILFVLSLGSDTFFTLFPWYLLWSLKMHLRDKIVLGSSMSLGLVAIVCAVMRLSYAEIISTDSFFFCRPLYARYLDKFFARTIPSYRRQRASTQPPIALRTIGGGASRPGQPNDGPEPGKGFSAGATRVGTCSTLAGPGGLDYMYPITADSVPSDGENMVSGHDQFKLPGPLPAPEIHVTREWSTTVMTWAEWLAGDSESHPMYKTVTTVEALRPPSSKDGEQ
ncbi:hypothetical protein B0T19DRAFT_463639 [Cercophora scortea]|uniref:Rhodopsin domain-containing protein n=1 Tax=Cercophora scortea TaxID=314031 RepID=A0AAE0M8Z9_9PEZI|nr:hypothetical protein B0T19DRAFT_463639 [Cercophora scortea]